jgi:hypothetical protein
MQYGLAAKSFPLRAGPVTEATPLSTKGLIGEACPLNELNGNGLDLGSPLY